MSSLFGRISLVNIFKGYKSTIYNYGVFDTEGKKNLTNSDKFLFIGLPLILGILFAFFDSGSLIKHWGSLISSLSIFVGLLFSFLTLVYGIAQKQQEHVYKIETDLDSQLDTDKEDLKDAYRDAKIKTVYILEVFKQISFAIAVSILSLILLFLIQIPITALYFKLAAWVKTCVNIPEWLFNLRYTIPYGIVTIKFIVYLILYVLLIEFILSLLMILKRFYILFIQEFEKGED